ncbi:MAG: nucleotidyltransferase [Caulobacterales bacterium]
MNAPFREPSSHILDEGDVLLADVAVRVQLPPSAYATAGQRFHTLVDWIERDESPLKGRVGLVYAQGGVATGSVIANRASNDEFDVDAMLGLLVPPASDPQWVLDTVFRVIRGHPRSRYFDATSRHTRCIKVTYADRMHVDLTPAVLLAGRPERESVIFHHRHETPDVPGRRVIANPFGFAEWFKANTPPEPMQQMAFADSAFAQRGLAKAQTEPLPDQLEPHETSRAIVSLQLHKRFRNLRYNDRDQRTPPSVLLSKQIAEHKVYQAGLGVALLSYATHLRDQVKAAEQSGQLIHATNPACPADVLTDRWPGTAADQTRWRRDLDYLVERLTLYVHGAPTLAQRQAILADLFGELAAKAAVLAFAEELGRRKASGQSRYVPGAGRLIVPAAPALVAAPRGRSEPATSYFGGTPWWRG